MKRTILLLFITLLVFCWNGNWRGPVPALGQITDRLQVIVIKGQFLGPNGKTIEEYDYLEPGRKYRLLPKAEVQLSTLDGKKTYEAVGPGIVFLDPVGSVLLNGKALKPKNQHSLLQDVTVTKPPSQELAGLPFRGIQVVPDQEKRSTIHEVDGYAYLPENMPLAQTRKTAFAAAKRQALEMAKTYIKSKSKVKQGVLEYDLIWADAEGAVSVLEQKDHGLKGNIYHVWIKAEVEYDLRPKKAGASQAAVIDVNAPLTVKVWSDKRAYQKGEHIRIFVQGNRDFYARIVDVTSDGRIIQLLPNDYRQSAFFQRGKTYTIPGPGDRFKLRVSPPFGREKVVVYASEVPIGDIPLEDIGAGLGSYAGSLESLARNVRSIMVIPAGSGPSNAEFYEAAWALETRPDGSSSRGTRKEEPDKPIDITGSAGRTEQVETPGR